MLRFADALTVPPRKTSPTATVLALNIPTRLELPETPAPMVELLAVNAKFVNASAMMLVTPTHVANESTDITTFDIALAILFSVY